MLSRLGQQVTNRINYEPNPKVEGLIKQEFDNTKKWAQDWYSSPEFKRRWTENMGGDVDGIEGQGGILNRVNDVSLMQDNSRGDFAYYNPSGNYININPEDMGRFYHNDKFVMDMNRRTMAHEMGHIPYNLRMIPKKATQTFNELLDEYPNVRAGFKEDGYSNLQMPNEMGANLMEIRRALMEATGKHTFDEEDLKKIGNFGLSNKWINIPTKKLLWFLNNFVSNDKQERGNYA